MASFCRSALMAGSRSISARSRTLNPKSLNGKPILSAFSSTTRDLPRVSRILSALGSVESLMPLHSAIASARLKSSIAVDSTCWSCLSQDSFLATPIILTNILRLSPRKKHMRLRLLDSIPEKESTEHQKDRPSRFPLQVSDYPLHKQENENCNLYSGTAYLDGEDEELTWFDAGVRVGIGIGLSICLGIGVGASLLVRTYQGTTRNFRRRLL